MYMTVDLCCYAGLLVWWCFEVCCWVLMLVSFVDVRVC